MKRQILSALASAVFLAAVSTASVTAAKPNQIAVTDGTFAGEASITFSTNLERPWAYAECFQDGVLVYAQFVALYDHPQQGDTFRLGPTPSWQGGDAECTADLLAYIGRSGTFSNPKATTTFHVSDVP